MVSMLAHRKYDLCRLALGLALEVNLVAVLALELSIGVLLGLWRVCVWMWYVCAMGVCVRSCVGSDGERVGRGGGWVVRKGGGGGGGEKI